MTDTFTPNVGQADAIDKFMGFLFQPTVGFNISGPAGTGKTATMKHFIDKTIPAYQETCKLMGIKPEFEEVVMTATTNKAAEVLSRATKYPTQTIHSFLNLKVTEDYSNGTMRLTKTTGFRVHGRKIIFVDEASMVDTSLFNFLQEGTEKCKIVFVGDMDQLSPIYEKLSPAYTQGYETVELTEQMRNNTQPALMDLCAQLRETVRTGVFKPIKLVSGVIDYIGSDEELMQGLNYLFKEPTKDHRVLAYTNARVRAYNHEIRKLRGLSEEFTLGETLIANQPFKASNGVQFSAEEEVKITRITKQHEEIEIIPNVKFKYNVCDVSNFFGDTIRDLKIPVDMEHYYEIIKYFAREKNWTQYFNMKTLYPDLRTRDAATTHKAQGSTYESVIIDLDDISSCRDPDQAARLLYVAFSRAKERVYIRGDLAAKFGGLDGSSYY
ncbi:ATP-dependent DNA helicase protein [Rhizobium phage RHph_Y2_6]|uniref:ATP-dependent DNA helicase protein n=2 Tax=Acanvirus TaxID=3044653 RepID=A0AAE7VMI6_9CAUD|nr:Dda-like helicase [Rhizobium phage RHph_Y2_6]YP_010658366.1 Dda-like helicase [Rhizobium phage RHEph16]QIG68797.1 ATP-dependent DNA helicase protein [Rhizobium phage RHph_Y2_6]QXV74365.1 ATP-dependent DNA helicase protein [Rhizobium phage RHEph16]